jgi:bifunctional non-homologous end joining protein LigD
MAFRPKKPAIGIKASYPGFIEPALATSIDKVPSGMPLPTFKSRFAE